MSYKTENGTITDPYLNEELARKRLVDEWQLHGKIIIAYDYDDTVFDFHKKGYQYNLVIRLLREARELGAYFIVHTCCSKEQEPEIREYLTANDIPFDSINENAPFIKFTGRKCYYNIMLDDRAGLLSAYQMLSLAIQDVKFLRSDIYAKILEEKKQ